MMRSSDLLRISFEGRASFCSFETMGFMAFLRRYLIVSDKRNAGLDLSTWIDTDIPSLSGCCRDGTTKLEDACVPIVSLCWLSIS